jgi:Domain of unknown function (DUF1929)
MLACAVVVSAFAIGALPAPAAARGRTVSERTVRNLETRVLGAPHAREHALERRAQRRAIAHWRALSPAKRRRVVRARRLSLHAASVGPASEVGSWASPFSLPVHAIHSAVLPTGKVMIWSYPFQATNSAPRALETHAYIWDPSMGTGSDAFHEVTPPADEISAHAMIFCSGGSLLADGRLLTSGGTLYWPDKDRPLWAGIRDLWTFNPWDETWTRQPDTAKGRWYPTQTELPDGRTLILGGYDEGGQQTVDTDLEVFKPSADPHGVGQVKLFPSGARNTGIYPHAFTMPNGQVLLAGQRSDDNALLTVTRKGSDGKPVDVFEWTDTERSSWRTLGTAILEPAGPAGSTRVTLIGGTNPKERDEVAAHTPARDTTQTLDVAHLGDGWQPAASLKIPRSNFNTVVLPDGSVVAVGGSNGTSDAEGLYASWDDHRSRQVEIRDPATGQWRLGATQEEDRAYHSTAVLLPDGRVLSGGDDRSGMRTSDTAEIYSPPYLFRGPRPLIGAAPAKLGYREPFRVGSSSNATRAVLMAPGVTTHGTEMQARHVELAITRRDSSGLNAVAPPSAGVAPPGWYMLFLLSKEGVPSVARWVHVEGTWTAPPPPKRTTFGQNTGVSTPASHVHLEGNDVRLRVTNANTFRVPTRAALRLTGAAAERASVGTPVVVNLTLPATGSATVRFRLGQKRAAFVRKRVYTGALLTLQVRDARGNKRTVKRKVTLLK